MARDDVALLWHCVDYWAGRKPDAEAVVFGERRMPWRELRDEVDAAARALMELGVRRGDRVAMVAMARPEFLVSFMAAAKVGAIWVGMSPKFTLEELHYQVKDCQPRVLIAQARFQDVDLGARVRAMPGRFACLEKVLVLDAEDGDEDGYAAFMARPRPEQEEALASRATEVNPEDEVLLMYTSGSTGKPKGVLHTHRSILTNVAVEKEHFGFCEQGRALLHFPINHVAADVEIGFTAIYGGATLVLMDRFDPQASLEVIERERVTIVGQVPVMFLMQMQTPRFREMDWSSVRAFVWAGSAASEIMLHVLSAICEKTGARLITGYGSTEVCGFCTYSAPEDSLDLLARSAGKTVPPFEIRIVDDDRNPLPAGEIGEIAIRGGIVMKGYLNNPEATAAAIDEDDWYYSNDMGCLDEAGYLFITGRKSDMFKTGGENVFPREVEAVLERHPAVLFAAVIGVPDAFYDEVGLGFVMLKPGQGADAEDLRAFCREHLANFKVPKQIDVRPSLPLLPNGKVNKMALKRELGLAPQ